MELRTGVSGGGVRTFAFEWGIEAAAKHTRARRAVQRALALAATCEKLLCPLACRVRADADVVRGCGVDARKERRAVLEREPVALAHACVSRGACDVPCSHASVTTSRLAGASSAIVHWCTVPCARNTARSVCVSEGDVCAHFDVHLALK